MPADAQCALRILSVVTPTRTASVMQQMDARMAPEGRDLQGRDLGGEADGTRDDDMVVNETWLWADLEDCWRDLLLHSGTACCGMRLTLWCTPPLNVFLPRAHAHRQARLG